jgi:ferredoxin
VGLSPREDPHSAKPFIASGPVLSCVRTVPSKKSLHIESSGQLCIYCGACVGICPLNCIYLDETRITFDERVCTRCEICVKACPVGAIEIG